MYIWQPVDSNYALKKNKNGKYFVQLIVRSGATQSSMATKVQTKKSDWLPKSQRIKGVSDDNEILDSIMERAQGALKSLRRNNRDKMKACDIIKYIKNYDVQNAVCSNGNFVDYWTSIAMQHPNSATKYKYALKSLIDFHIVARGTDVIHFSDITSDYIRLYISYIRETPYIPLSSQRKNEIRYQMYSSFTIATYIAVVKAVINCAIDDEKLSSNVLRGFRKSGVKVETNNREVFALSLVEIKRIYRFEIDEKKTVLRMARDLFILSFCLQGMNLTDLYHLRKADINGVEVRYKRQKTNKIIAVTLGEKDSIMKLCEPYMCSTNMWGDSCGRSDYVFAFNYHYSNYTNFKGLIVKAMRELRKMLGLSNGFTFYTARDTWATICSADYNLGQEYIDAGLGHSSKSLAANHYISIDRQKIVATHQDILKRLFEE